MTNSISSPTGVNQIHPASYAGYKRIVAQQWQAAEAWGLPYTSKLPIRLGLIHLMMPSRMQVLYSVIWK
jgi:hypothetical protein